MSTPINNNGLQTYVNSIVTKIKDTSYRIGFGRKVRDQHQIRKRLKVFYKKIEIIKEPLFKLIQTQEKALSTNLTNIKGIDKINKKSNETYQDDIKSFKKDYDLDDSFLSLFPSISSTTTGTIQGEVNYNRDLYNLLFIEKGVLDAFVKIKDIIDPTKNIQILYNNAVKALERIYYLQSKIILYRKPLDNKNTIDTDNNFQTINNFLNTVKTFTEKEKNSTQIQTSKSLQSNLSNNKYKYNDISIFKDRTYKNDLVKWFRKLTKEMFDAMQEYYYNDLKFKYKWSYKSLNNSYQKSKIKGFKSFKHSLASPFKALTGLGEHMNSPVHLGPAYKISPILGGIIGKMGKALHKFSDNELNNHYEALKKQIGLYRDKLNELEPQKHGFTYYEIKDRLAKEIRKIKIIKYFLLQKTVRLKRKVKSFGFTKKLINTVDTLKAKIQTRTPEITSNPERQAAIETLLINIDTEEQIQLAINEITKEIAKIGGLKGVKLSAQNAIGFGKKNKTLKRLQKLKNMVRAETKVKDINKIVEENYTTYDRKNSTNIKSEIDRLIGYTKTKAGTFVANTLSKQTATSSVVKGAQNALAVERAKNAEKEKAAAAEKARKDAEEKEKARVAAAEVIKKEAAAKDAEKERVAAEKARKNSAEVIKKEAAAKDAEKAMVADEKARKNSEEQAAAVEKAAKEKAAKEKAAKEKAAENAKALEAKRIANEEAARQEAAAALTKQQEEEAKALKEKRIANEEAVRQESTRQEAARQEAARQEAAKTEEAKTEEAKKIANEEAAAAKKITNNAAAALTKQQEEADKKKANEEAAEAKKIANQQEAASAKKIANEELIQQEKAAAEEARKQEEAARKQQEEEAEALRQKEEAARQQQEDAVEALRQKEEAQQQETRAVEQQQETQEEDITTEAGGPLIIGGGGSRKITSSRKNKSSKKKHIRTKKHNSKSKSKKHSSSRKKYLPKSKKNNSSSRKNKQ